jgi:hypothetical protein
LRRSIGERTVLSAVERYAKEAMMRRINMLALALLAVAAIGAITAGLAAARKPVLSITAAGVEVPSGTAFNLGASGWSKLSFVRKGRTVRCTVRGLELLGTAGTDASRHDVWGVDRGWLAPPGTEPFECDGLGGGLSQVGSPWNLSFGANGVATVTAQTGKLQLELEMSESEGEPAIECLLEARQLKGVNSATMGEPQPLTFAFDRQRLTRGKSVASFGCPSDVKVSFGSTGIFAGPDESQVLEQVDP